MNAIDRLNPDPDTRARLYALRDTLMVDACAARSVGEVIASHTRPAAAIHEAGHAVVAAAHGQKPGRVRVFRRGPEWGGLTDGGGPGQGGGPGPGKPDVAA